MHRHVGGDRGARRGRVVLEEPSDNLFLSDHHTYESEIALAKKTLSEVLAAAAPKPAPRAVVEAEVRAQVDDLDRILSLPRRPPLDLSFDPVTKRHKPDVQALIEVMTARLGRGRRISCGCRPRVIQARDGGTLVITRVLPEEVIEKFGPEAPVVTTVKAFVADNQANDDEIAIAERVSRLKAGERLDVEACDGGEGHFCFDTLNAFQAWALYEIPKEGGGIGFSAVGSGKSGFFLLFPIALGDECETAALLIEPNQRVHYRSQYVRIREHFRVPSLIPEDGGRTYMVPGAPPLHLVAYSKLGNPKHPEGLDILNPNVVLPDEAHRLTGKSQSTTRKRVKRLIAKRIKEREEMMARGLPVRRRAVYFVPMSGTLEDKSIEDTQPVSAFALGTNSPLPLDEAEAAAWSLCIDPIKSGNDTKSKTAKRLQRAFTGKVFQAVEIEDLLDDEGPTNEIRKGFCARRMETPGVITASATDVTTSISFKRRDAPAMPEIVKEALRMVREEGLRPDGEPIVGDEDESMAAMIKAVARQVASGHFNFWAYPKIPCTCAGREPRCEGCKKIDWWFEFRKRYFAESRKILLESLPHLDSPKLCKNAAIRAQEDTSHPTGVDIYCVKCREPWPCYKLESDHLPAWRANTFKEWHEIEDKVPHEKRVRWIGDKTPEAEDPATHPGYFLARDTTKWALENTGVIWVQTIAYGEKIAQLAKIPYYGGGPNNETMIRAENGKRSIILALKAWGKGLDSLQLKFYRQLFPEFFSGNRVGEQVLGRLARRGQKKDTVLSEYYAHVQEIRDAIRTVRRLAEFNQAMSGNKALILAADWDDE